MRVNAIAPGLTATARVMEWLRRGRQSRNQRAQEGSPQSHRT